MNYYQKCSSALSFIVYLIAFLYSLSMTATRDLMVNNHSNELDPWKVAVCFGIGAAVWVVSLVLLRTIIYFEVRLQRLQGSIRYKVYLLLLSAPGLLLFPSLSGIYSKYFTDSAGCYILWMLSLSSFILDLTFPHEIEFGQVDMFEGVHLPILSSIEKSFYIVLCVACVYYLRKFFLLAFNEIIKAHQREDTPGLRQEEQTVIPIEEMTHAEDEMITVDEVEVSVMQQLLNGADEYVEMTKADTMFKKVFTNAYIRGEIDMDTVTNYNRRLDNLANSVETAQLHLQQNQDHI